MKITFCGATEEVTGSRFLLEHGHTKVLIDCGLFQGSKELTKHNWDKLPIDPAHVDAIVLTHAHVDHTGYIPAFIKKGFKGPIYCSMATYELCSLVLLDSGSVQEQNALKHKTMPLYTQKDAQHSLAFFKPKPYDAPFNVGSLTVTLIASYHILGSAFIIVSDGEQTISFSGDLGHSDRFMTKAPPYIKKTDFLVLESTYGDRLHEHNDDPLEDLKNIIHDAVQKKGVVIIPSFAVERTQEVIYCLYQLKQKGAIPEIPIFLDSPLAIGVSNLYCHFPEEHTIAPNVCKAMFQNINFIKSIQESMKIDALNHAAIIIAGSGMADGGRVLDHFKYYISQPKNTVVFVGFQAPGTNGYDLVNGEKTIRIDGIVYPVHATIKMIRAFSAHADYNDTLQWLEHFEKAPKKVFLTHGELESARSLKKKIEDKFGWSVTIPKYRESFELK